MKEYDDLKYQIESIMKHPNQMKLTYSSPQVKPTEVAFEQALLVTTTRLLMYVDEAENVNAGIDDADEPGGEMYFEF
jgi:hypothetical protein